MAAPPLQQMLAEAGRYHQTGRLGEAERLYQQILAEHPGNAEALDHLGVIACQSGRHNAGVELIERAVALAPDEPAYQHDLGIACIQMAKWDKAAAALGLLVELKPADPDAHFHLGNALREQGNLERAIAAYRQANVLRPSYPEALINLGIALAHSGKLDEATESYRRAIVQNPNIAEAYTNLGLALRDQGQLSEAVAAYRQALVLKPDHPQTLNNLGVALMQTGQTDAAIAAYRQAIAARGDYAQAHSNLLYAIHLHPDYDGESIAAQHRNWNDRQARALLRFMPVHRNTRDPERRLRIGYFSPDFGQHPVGIFLLPLLENHDKSRFEIFAYAQVTAPDALTDQLRSYVDHWRNIARLSDARVAELIHRDQIDILVDLAGHTAGNRLLVFARKPAPIQITYLGYPDTSGLTAMDYRLTDGFADPPGMTEQFHSEKLLRLPRNFVCYKPPADAPEASALPAMSRGHITFGSFNALGKMNDRILELWRQILHQVPRSRIMIKNAGLQDDAVKREMLERFSIGGIESSRVDLRSHVRTAAEHLKRYDEMDIALDTFPYHGTTTTCEAMWMGVPVVTLEGDRHASRVGVSLLANLNLTELVAKTPEEYVGIAVRLAGDLPRLSDLRAGLRARFKSSPLMDAAGFAREVEAQYRQVWQEWCTQP
ncbi:MAG: tetratricopeptide repeat protein [Tepidisphaeraceae bacterium]|jgi:predicted O-linked N-acetylglucosamine transferase (SPINDLY family)